ncbi:MAG: hypothetical protein AAF657_30080 [Acidobacteriota bacterium]
MSTLEIHQIPIFPTVASVADPQARRGHCKVSEDLAERLGISASVCAGQPIRLRVAVTASDVHTLYNADYADFLGSNAHFYVDEVIAGSERIEIYPNSGPGAKDGGVFELFGRTGNPFAGVRIPAGARVTLSVVRSPWREPNPRATEQGRRAAEPEPAAAARRQRSVPEAPLRRRRTWAFWPPATLPG